LVLGGSLHWIFHKDLIEKYREKYPFFENNLEEANEDIPYITIPENYCCIKRYWFKEKTAFESNFRFCINTNACNQKTNKK
jgi:hypothetical protein